MEKFIKPFDLITTSLATKRQEALAEPRGPTGAGAGQAEGAARARLAELWSRIVSPPGCGERMPPCGSRIPRPRRRSGTPSAGCTVAEKPWTTTSDELGRVRQRGEGGRLPSRGAHGDGRKQLWRRSSSSAPSGTSRGAAADRPGHHRPGDGPADRAIGAPGGDALHRRQQVGHHRGTRGLRRLLLRPGAPDQGRPGGRELRRHHRPRERPGSAGRGAPLPPDLPRVPGHRRALLGALLLRPGAGGAHGPGRGGVPGTGAEDGPRLRIPACSPATTRESFSARPSASWRGPGATSSPSSCPRQIDTLGLWLEQLVAESTGKEGTGHPADRRRAARPARGLRR